MRRRRLLVLATFVIACGSEGAPADSSIEVSSTSPATTVSARTATTTVPTTSAATTSTQVPNTTTPPTTTTRAPTTTTAQVATTTTVTTTTTTTAATTTTTTTTTTTPSTTVNITATNFAFSPSSVTINRGDTVQWVLGSGGHTTTSGLAPNPDGGWDQTITSPVAIVFSQSGQFNFFCRFHPDAMQGTIIVP